MSKDFVLITFNNMNETLMAEDLFKGKECRTIPTPTQIDNTCGLSLKCNILDLEFFITELENVSYKNIYTYKGENYKKIK